MKKKHNEVTTLIKMLKKMEKDNPTIILIPENEFLNPEKLEEGELLKINNACILTGMQIKKTEDGKYLFLTTKRILQVMLEQAFDEVPKDDLLMPLDSILIKEEDVKKMKEEINKKKES